MNFARQRPLTLMFAVAGLAATMFLIASDAQPPGLAGNFMIGLFFGQLWLIAGWAAVGRASRLARGFGMLIGILGMASIISFLHSASPTISEWGRALAPSCIVAAPTFVSALLLKLFFDWKGIERGERFHFRIKELFAWMVIVAIASWVLGFANFRPIFSANEPLAKLAVSSIVAGLVMAVHRYRDSIPFRLVVLCCVFLGAVAIAFSASSQRRQDRELNAGFLGGGVYLLGILLANAGDRRFFSRSNSEGRPQETPALLSQQD
jgi:hypothetical protein